MNAAELKNRIVSGGLDEKLTVLYGGPKSSLYRSR